MMKTRRGIARVVVAAFLAVAALQGVAAAEDEPKTWCFKLSGKTFFCTPPPPPIK